MKKSKLKQGYFKQVPLLPSMFYLDVWVCNNSQKLCEHFAKRYGGSVERYQEDYYPDMVTRIYSSKDSELKGTTRIVLVMEDFDNKVIAHELIHVMWHFAEECNLEMNYNSQEWQAILFEYLFTQCQFDNSFTQLPK